MKKENNNLLERIGFGAMSIIEREKLITRIEELSSLIGNYRADLDTHKVIRLGNRLIRCYSGFA